MTLTKGSIHFPFIVSEFKFHSDLKQDLLKLIELEKSNTVKNDRDIIEKTDYDFGNFVDKEYFKKLLKPVVEHMFPILNSLQIKDFKIDSCWFQQYTFNDTHSWHRHPNTQYANVYYLELPSDGPTTELRSPFDNETIIEPKVSEGSILTFPGMVVHRSAPNKSKQRKTVIAFNISEVGVSV